VSCASPADERSREEARRRDAARAEGAEWGRGSARAKRAVETWIHRRRDVAMSAPSIWRDAVVRQMLSRIGVYVAVCLVTVFFALPLLWLVLTPLSKNPSYRAALSHLSLDNFEKLVHNPQVLRSLKNSVYLGGGSAILVMVFAALAAYALSRVRIPGRDQLLYVLLLLSSIVTGTPWCRSS
jgi:ABC-type glycerol-3-phosphate transport system permease component